MKNNFLKTLSPIYLLFIASTTCVNASTYDEYTFNNIMFELGAELTGSVIFDSNLGTITYSDVMLTSLPNTPLYPSSSLSLFQANDTLTGGFLLFFPGMFQLTDQQQQSYLTFDAVNDFICYPSCVDQTVQIVQYTSVSYEIPNPYLFYFDGTLSGSITETNNVSPTGIVPEPSSIALLAAGLFSFTARRVR